MSEPQTYDEKMAYIQGALEQGMSALLEALAEIESKDALISEMLDALRTAKDLADVMEKMTACRSDDEWVWAAQEKINAAIAKAEGKDTPSHG